VAAWPRQTAGAVSKSLVLGLAKLGVRASARARTRRAVDRHNAALKAQSGSASASTAGLSDLCFMSGEENEIEACGRKLAGCAHKFTREAFFSHGSIMTGPSHVHVARLVRADALTSPDDVAQSIAEKSVSLSQLLPAPPAAGEMEAAFKSAFEEVFGLSFARESLSRSDVGLVEERAAEKRAVLAAESRAAQPTGGAC
jgi:lipoate-protein ligase A